MPRVYEKLGLSFYIYLQDHQPPHVHVKYGEYELTINIESSEKIKGYLPIKQRKLAIEIVKNNQQFFKEEFNKYL
jgi:hypothetical protein